MRIEIGSLDGAITEKLKRVEAFLKLAGDGGDQHQPFGYKVVQSSS